MLERHASGLSELSAKSNDAVTTSNQKVSPTTGLPQPSSVHRKGTLSRLPAFGTYTTVKTKLTSDRPEDESVMSINTKFASAAADIDKRKTVTAVRSLSMHHTASTSGPLKTIPSSVTPRQLDCIDGVLSFI